MVTTTQAHIAQVAEALASNVNLTANQRGKIKTEVTADPRGRGYAGMAQFDLCIALAMPYQIPNPDPQGTVTFRTRNDALRKLYHPRILGTGQLTWQHF